MSDLFAMMIISLIHVITGSSVDVLSIDEELKMLVDTHLVPEGLDEVNRMDSLDLSVHVLLGGELDQLDRG